MSKKDARYFCKKFTLTKTWNILGFPYRKASKYSIMQKQNKITKSAFLQGEERQEGDFTPKEIFAGDLANPDKSEKILLSLKQELTADTLYKVWNIGYCLGKMKTTPVLHVFFADAGIQLFLYPSLLMITRQLPLQDDLPRLSLLILKNGLKVAIEPEISTVHLQKFIEHVYLDAQRQSLLRRGQLVFQRESIEI